MLILYLEAILARSSGGGIVFADFAEGMCDVLKFV